jgi:hypothetical protein
MGWKASRGVGRRRIFSGAGTAMGDRMFTALGPDALGENAHATASTNQAVVIDAFGSACMDGTTSRSVTKLTYPARRNLCAWFLGGSSIEERKVT